MIHFLRNQSNDTLVEVSATKDDLSVVVDLIEFAEILLAIDGDIRAAEFVREFHDVQELRGEYFEHPDMARGGGKHPETPDEFVGRRLKEVGQRWNLAYVTD